MPTIKRQYIKLKRNSLCPCDDNDKREKPLKYKQCCLREVQDSEQQLRMLFHHDKRVEKAKKEMDEAIQLEKDHPIILIDKCICAPETNSKIIIP